MLYKAVNKNLTQQDILQVNTSFVSLCYCFCFGVFFCYCTEWAGVFPIMNFVVAFRIYKILEPLKGNGTPALTKISALRIVFVAQEVKAKIVYPVTLLTHCTLLMPSLLQGRITDRANKTGCLRRGEGKWHSQKNLLLQIQP